MATEAEREAITHFAFTVYSLSSQCLHSLLTSTRYSGVGNWDLLTLPEQWDRRIAR